jgi:DNA-binding NtrC family response regulator
MAKILVVDDELVFRKVISTILTNQGYEVVTASSAQEALDLLQTEPIDLLISDIRMDPISGIDLLKRVSDMHKTLCVIMLTSCEEVTVAIQSMKLGAFDYLTKPIQMNELVQATQRALEYSHSVNSRLAAIKLECHKDDEKLKGMVAKSGHMIRVCDMIERIAPTENPVLICGETGSGTELAARNIHRCSRRSDMPFVKIDCETIPPEQMETELFGKDNTHQGSLLEASFGGTLFIHEVGRMPLPVQERLSRAMEEYSALKHQLGAGLDVRVITSSSDDMHKRVQNGTFMEELYRRLSSFSINIPALRDRKDDIIPLTARFVARHIGPSAEMPLLNRATEELLKHYLWPGNINELVSTVQYMLAHLENNTITIASLPPDLAEEASIASDMLKVLKQPESLKGRSLKAFLHNENGPIQRALKQNNVRSESPAEETPPIRPKDPNATAPDDSSPYDWI